jgi:hypothetical protein
MCLRKYVQAVWTGLNWLRTCPVTVLVKDMFDIVFDTSNFTQQNFPRNGRNSESFLCRKHFLLAAAEKFLACYKFSVPSCSVHREYISTHNLNNISIWWRHKVLADDLYFMSSVQRSKQKYKETDAKFTSSPTTKTHSSPLSHLQGRSHRSTALSENISVIVGNSAGLLAGRSWF